MPSKKKKSKISKYSTVSNKPEQVFKVVAKKRVVTKKKTAKKNKKFSTHDKLSAKTIIITIAITVSIAGAVVSYAGKNMLDALQETKRPTGSLEISSQAAADLKLLGSKSNYPNEILNYQSAPADLQDYILRDYTLHKANCIVNGQYVGTLHYEVVNVVYDKFAKISKDCNGADTVILAKISGTWTAIVNGNDLPTCNEVNAYDIPQGISFKCRDGFVTYTNPNP